MGDEELPGDIAGTDAHQGQFHNPSADAIRKWATVDEDASQLVNTCLTCGGEKSLRISQDAQENQKPSDWLIGLWIFGPGQWCWRQASSSLSPPSVAPLENRQDDRWVRLGSNYIYFINGGSHSRKCYKVTNWLRPIIDFVSFLVLLYVAQHLNGGERMPPLERILLHTTYILIIVSVWSTHSMSIIVKSNAQSRCLWRIIKLIYKYYYLWAFLLGCCTLECLDQAWRMKYCQFYTHSALNRRRVLCRKYDLGIPLLASENSTESVAKLHRIF